MKGWLNYWRTVGDRITWDRSVLRGLWIVPWLHCRLRLGRPRRTGTIAYFPHPAGPWYSLPLALAGTGIRKTRSIQRADLLMVFEDRTVSDIQPPDIDGQCLNDRAIDISKINVGRVFETVFGYSLTLDPSLHVGPMVQKSDANGVHDGKIVQGPLQHPMPDCVYQRLADSTIREGVTEDLRCVCVRGRVIQVFRKEKATESRFQAVYLETTLRDADEVFSAEEQKKIAAFCQMIGLDFGSMDILRDYASDGRIYIVDVNKTCMPVLSMPAKELEKGLRRIGAAFETLMLSPGL